MQFVRNGPDIPESLLQAHEEGNVVFFCGAGVSYPAGLPDFKGLVDQLYQKLNATKEIIEQRAFEQDKYDATIDLLERRYPGSRVAVRTVLIDILKPKWRKKGATTTHESLLRLATDRNDKVRLVTTNFDRIFVALLRRRNAATPCFAAPLLPIPKPSRWNGVVHLHGLLPQTDDETDLNKLVLSSGDFGLAYLTERWASRFLSDIFRNYTVCFVGYSINDPVLRYMMDALAVDDMFGEARPKAYAFGSFSDGQRDQQMIEWEAKGVTPLLYPADNNHSSLHRTLKEWADTYRDGVHGKEMIIAQHAPSPPLAPSRSDFAVGRVLWALTDGLATRHFADLVPVPPLKWLEALLEVQFRHNDLSRFGVAPSPKADDCLPFSFAQRPTPYNLAPLMALVDYGSSCSRWDEVMRQLARWLLRHLNDSDLVLRLASLGGQLHQELNRLIERRIAEIESYERDDKQHELAILRNGATNAIPNSAMRVLWRLFLTRRIKSSAPHFGLHDCLDRLTRDAVTATLRLELRDALAACVLLRQSFRQSEGAYASGEVKSIKELVDWEIVLATDHVHSALHNLKRSTQWNENLRELLSDFTTLLRDALDLMRELGGLSKRHGLSHYHQPSISEHAQNRDFRDWTALIDLNRDALIATAAESPDRARLVAEEWWHLPYPLFKRLALFAAALEQIIPARQAINWLLADEHWFLWSAETQREVIRLIVAIAPKLDATSWLELEMAILTGPPREMYEDLDSQTLARIVDREVWLRLAKAEAAGAPLTSTGVSRLAEIRMMFPQWQVAADEHDEFSFWIGDDDAWREMVVTPRDRRGLVEWLKKNQKSSFLQDDEWKQRCRYNFPAAACALFSLSQQNIWPAERWREALQAWSEGKLLQRSWRYISPVLLDAPAELLQDIAHSLSWWLQTNAATFLGYDEIFLKLCRRVLSLDHQNQGYEDDPVGRAINNPVGHVTEALLRWWYRQSPKDGQRLPHELNSIFTQICNVQIEKFQSGRVLLGAHVINLFRVDEEWARTNLLLLFDWRRSTTEARLVWEGFLWAPRLYRPLMEAIRQPFLDSAQHYDSLGKHDEQYAALLTFAALDRGGFFSEQEIADATRSLPIKGLRFVAQTLVRALEGAGDERDDYWTNRIVPYLKSVWPKSNELITVEISEVFARLCVAAQHSFPDALDKLRHWLQPLQHPDYAVHKLYEGGLSETFPEAALQFLDLIVGNNSQWPPRHLRNCLDSIRQAQPSLVADNRYRRLDEYIRRNGRE